MMEYWNKEMTGLKAEKWEEGNIEIREDWDIE